MLVGPNGAGKTTLFDGLNFVRLTAEVLLSQAVAAAGGPFLRHLAAPPDAGVEFTLNANECTWNLNVSFGPGPQNLSYIEQLRDPSGEHHGTGEHDGGLLRRLANYTVVPQHIRPFLANVKSFLVYGGYVLHQLRERGSQNSSELRLSSNGANGFTVLRNWLGRREYREAYDFLGRQLDLSFPGVSDHFDFEFTTQINSLRLFHGATGSQPIPVALAPNGWLAALLHLMAVVGTERGGVVMIDEFENSLHPYAIRMLVRAIREWAGKFDLTVILAGHSLALLDEFKDEPSRVFVLEPWRAGQPSMPLRLTDYRDPEWLKHFSLGELYRHEDFGGPLESLANGAPAAAAS
jgi:predicted ATPase